MSLGYKTFARLTADDFDAYTFDSSTPSLVLFAAERCDICKELVPIVDELIDIYADRLNVYYVDVDKYAGLHKRFLLRGIPQMLIFKQNEMKKRIGGLHEKEEILEVIDSVLKEE